MPMGAAHRLEDRDRLNLDHQSRKGKRLDGNSGRGGLLACDELGFDLTVDGKQRGVDEEHGQL